MCVHTVHANALFKDKLTMLTNEYVHVAVYHMKQLRVSMYIL